jgi:molybdopterin-guanine dinucleotide biosynthesis protein A
MTAVVIAGGQSRRMRVDKAFVEVGGRLLIERVLDVIVPLFSHIFINSNRFSVYQKLGFPVITDVERDKGALGGIYTGLVHAKTDYVFCVACDMPSLNQDLIRYMTESIDGCDALIPKTPDGLHPLHAIYSKRCMTGIEELLQQNILKISRLFPKIRSCYMTEEQISWFDPHFESFLNVNTWQDIETARKKYEQSAVSSLQSPVSS